MAVQGAPVIIATNGKGTPVQSVAAGKGPLLTIATNGKGAPIVIVTKNAPAFVIQGV